VRLERQAKTQKRFEEACNSSFVGQLADCFSSCEIAIDARVARAVKEHFVQQFPRPQIDRAGNSSEPANSAEDIRVPKRAL
jgi:hypothetical protein